MTTHTLLQDAGFMYHNEFSNSYSLKVMCKNMVVRLELIRGLNPDHESVFKTSDMIRTQSAQYQK